MSNYKKTEYIHHAIQEAINGDISLLEKALEYVEDIRELYLCEQEWLGENK